MFRIEKLQNVFTVSFDGFTVAVSPVDNSLTPNDFSVAMARKIKFLANYTVRHSYSNNKPQVLKDYFEQTGWRVILPSDYESVMDLENLSAQ